VLKINAGSLAGGEGRDWINNKLKKKQTNKEKN